MWNFIKAEQQSFILAACFNSLRWQRNTNGLPCFSRPNDAALIWHVIKINKQINTVSLVYTLMILLIRIRIRIALTTQLKYVTLCFSSELQKPWEGCEGGQNGAPIRTVVDFKCTATLEGRKMKTVVIRKVSLSAFRHEGLVYVIRWFQANPTKGFWALGFEIFFPKSEKLTSSLFGVKGQH